MPDTMTREIARKMLEDGFLSEPPRFTLKDLFCIRDSLEILNDYDLADVDLLKEVKAFIHDIGSQVGVSIKNTWK